MCGPTFRATHGTAQPPSSRCNHSQFIGNLRSSVAWWRSLHTQYALLVIRISHTLCVARDELSVVANMLRRCCRCWRSSFVSHTSAAPSRSIPALGSTASPGQPWCGDSASIRLRYHHLKLHVEDCSVPPASAAAVGLMTQYATSDTLLVREDTFCDMCLLQLRSRCSYWRS
jgi:hypothetical protein